MFTVGPLFGKLLQFMMIQPVTMITEALVPDVLGC